VYCEYECILINCRDIVAAIDRQQSFQASKLYYVVSVNVFVSLLLYFLIQIWAALQSNNEALRPEWNVSVMPRTGATFFVLLYDHYYAPAPVGRRH